MPVAALSRNGLMTIIHTDQGDIYLNFILSGYTQEHFRENVENTFLTMVRSGTTAQDGERLQDNMNQDMVDRYIADNPLNFEQSPGAASDGGWGLSTHCSTVYIFREDLQPVTTESDITYIPGGYLDQDGNIIPFRLEDVLRHEIYHDFDDDLTGDRETRAIDFTNRFCHAEGVCHRGDCEIITIANDANVEEQVIKD